MGSVTDLILVGDEAYTLEEWQQLQARRRRDREYALKHRAERSAYHREWRARNRERWNAYKREWARRKRAEQRKAT